MKAKFSALGTYVPEQVVTNHYFEGFIETSDEWIRSRTGIQERRFAREEEFTSDLCVEAVRNLAAKNAVSIEDVDFIIVATVTHDQVMPGVASQVQDKLQIPSAGTLDISAACAGFVYGLIVAKGLVAAGSHRKVLVIGAETLSKFTDFTDRTTCILFGDGAGAALIELAEEGNMLQSITGTYGAGGKELYMSGLATALNGAPVIANNRIHQNGRAVFKWAVNTISEQIMLLLEKNRLKLEDIDWFIPHSANLRITEAICRETGIPFQKALSSMMMYGNTSSASIPLALQEGLKEEKVKSGDRLLLIGFGGGLTYAGMVIEW